MLSREQVKELYYKITAKDGYVREGLPEWYDEIYSKYADVVGAFQQAKEGKDIPKFCGLELAEWNFIKQIFLIK